MYYSGQTGDEEQEHNDSAGHDVLTIATSFLITFFVTSIIITLIF